MGEAGGQVDFSVDGGRGLRHCLPSSQSSDVHCSRVKAQLKCVDKLLGTFVKSPRFRQWTKSIKVVMKVNLHFLISY